MSGVHRDFMPPQFKNKQTKQVRLAGWLAGWALCSVDLIFTLTILLRIPYIAQGRTGIRTVFIIELLEQVVLFCENNACFLKHPNT